MANNTNSYSTANKVEVLVMYKECMHNHAAQTTGFVLDGCGMFEPSGPSESPEAKICAACHCHRNFHRRVEVELPQSHPSHQHGTMVIHTPVPQTRVHQQTSTSHATASESGHDAVADLVPEPQAHVREQMSTHNGATTAPSPATGGQETGQPQEVPAQHGRSIAGVGVPGRTRRMTRQQSNRVRALCERNGWKMFRDYTAEEVTTICADIGITRMALKSCICAHRSRRAALVAAETH